MEVREEPKGRVVEVIGALKHGRWAGVACQDVVVRGVDSHSWRRLGAR